MAYIILALSALIPAVWLFLRRRDPIMVATYTLAAGLITGGDYVALGIFHLYSYHTGLIGGGNPNDMLGVMLAEWVFVPSLIVATQCFLSGWPAVALETLAVVVVEALFLRLGLFAHHGWSIWYTAIGFAIYFRAIDRFWQKAHQDGLATGWPLVAHRLFLGVFTWAVPTANLTGLFHVVRTKLSLLPRYWPNQALGQMLTDGIWTGPVFFWVLMGGRERRWGRWGAASIFFALQAVTAQAIGVRYYLPPWNPLLQTLTRSATLACACLIGGWVEARAGTDRIRPRVR